MTREEVLRWLLETRSEFNELVAAIPRDKLEKPIPGKKHSAKDVIHHVVCYEDLIVQRLRAAQTGEMTAFDRDRQGWEQYNASVWAEAATVDANTVLARSQRVFNELIAEVRVLQDDELNGTSGIVKHLDPAWLDGRALYSVIAIDAIEHYPMHFDDLKNAAAA